MEIVKLIGADVLPDDQRAVYGGRPGYPSGLPAAERISIRTIPIVPLEKQKLMMKAILLLYHNSLNAINGGKPISG